MKAAYKWQILLIISIGIFMSTLDGSILNIANPTIAENLQVNLQQIQWVATAYMLVITSTLLLFGKLGDELGSSRIFTYGFLLFTLGSFFCSLSPSLSFLTGSRVFQAFGASMMMATGMGIISNTFPAGERGRAFGLSGSMVGLGNMAGPSLGGILVANFGWPSIFLVNIPIGIIGFLLAYKYLPRDSKNTIHQSLDLKGFVLFALTAVVLVLSLSLAPGIDLWLFLLGLLILTLFLHTQRQQANPLLDLTLFKIKNFVYGNLLGFISYLTQTFVLFLLPFYMEQLLNFSPRLSGIMMTIPPVCMAVTAPISGYLSDKLGTWRLTSAAFILLTCSHLIFSTLSFNQNLYKLILGLGLLGIGMGCFGSPNSNAIFGSVPKNKAGYTGGFLATVRNFSFALGVAGSASLFTLLLNIYQHQVPFIQAYSRAGQSVYLIAALLTFTGLIISVNTRHSRGNNPDTTSFDLNN